MNDPSISVVVPCRNEQRTLESCLHALARQDFPRDRFEIIVVDGGSTDGSRDVARQAGVRILEDDGRGPGGARNVGIRAARGEVVAFTDADCAPRSDWLTRVAEVFAEDPSIAGVAGSLRMPRRTLIGRMEDLEARAYYRGVITSNVAYRRDVLLEVGGFDESLCCAEDFDLAWRAMDAGHRVVHDPRPVVVHDPPEVSGGAWRYLRKHFWYARNDVPASVRALRRVRRAGSAGAPGSASALEGVGRAAIDSGLAAAAVGGLLAWEVGALGLAGSALASYRRLARAARAHAEPRAGLPAMVALATARRVARGLGTLAGLAELALPANRRAFSAPSRVSIGPAAPRAGWPPAAGAPRLPT